MGLQTTRAELDVRVGIVCMALGSSTLTLWRDWSICRSLEIFWLWTRCKTQAFCYRTTVLAV